MHILGQESFSLGESRERRPAAVGFSPQGSQGAAEPEGDRVGQENPPKLRGRLALRNRGQMEPPVQEAQRLATASLFEDGPEHGGPDPPRDVGHEGAIQEHRIDQVHHMEHAQAAAGGKGGGQRQEPARGPGLHGNELALRAGEGEEVEHVFEERSTKGCRHPPILAHGFREGPKHTGIPEPQHEVFLAVLGGSREKRDALARQAGQDGGLVVRAREIGAKRFGERGGHGGPEAPAEP